MFAFPTGRVHALVVVSDMSVDVDWGYIAEELLEKSDDRTMYQVLDAAALQEVSTLARLSAGNAEVLLDHLLMSRWRRMSETSNALISLRLAEG